MARTTYVSGVDSTLPDGNHILMWDFDHAKLWEVRDELEKVQSTYELPNIYIFNTGRPDGFIAYCFKKVPWRKAVEILAYTKNVCQSFFKFGVLRERFTLRVSPKCGRTPKLATVILSPIPEDAMILDLKNWVRYETLEDGQETKVKEWKVGK